MLEDSEARDFKQLHGMPSEDLQVSWFPSALLSSVTFRLDITWKKYFRVLKPLQLIAL